MGVAILNFCLKADVQFTLSTFARPPSFLHPLNIYLALT